MADTQGQNIPEDSEIRELAYRLWEEAGRPSGRQEEFWLQAEEQLGRRSVPNDDLDIAGEDSFPASDPVNHT